MLKFTRFFQFVTIFQMAFDLLHHFQEAVVHTLMHGMSKCTTSVAFHEEFEEVTGM